MNTSIRVLAGLLVVTGLCTTAGAQQTGRLTGRVLDARTGGALDRANIRVLGTTLGTITNSEGSYRLVLPPGSYRIVFAYMGYHSDTLSVDLGVGTLERDVRLLQVVLEMPDMVVLSDALSPAEELVRRAIAARQAMMASLLTLRHEAYTRTVVTYRDSSGVPEIGGILETQTTGYWQSPDEYLERVIARKQSAQFTPAMNIFTAGRMPNFNQNRVVAGNMSILTPLADSALDHYSYSIVDTLMTDGGPVYRVKVEPKNQVVPLFDGTISIADGTWMLMEVDLGGNQATERPPMVGWRLRQQFAPYEGRFWLPIDSTVRLTFDMMDFPVDIEMHAVLYDHEINPELSPAIFGRYETVVESTADRPDPAMWEGRQVLPLTMEEETAYERIERQWQETSPFFRTVYKTLSGQFGSRRSIFAAPSDFFHFNRVEGAYLGVGLAFRDHIPLTSIAMKAGYGTSDTEFKYRFELERVLFEEPELVAGAAIERDLIYREGMQVYSKTDITWQTLFYKVDPVDYFKREGWSAWIRLRPAGSMTGEFIYRDGRHTSVGKHSDFSFVKRSESYRPNPDVIAGTLRSGTISAELDTRKYLKVGTADVLIEGKNTIRLRGELEVSDTEAWKSDFTFTRGMAVGECRLRTVGAGYLDVIAVAGYSWGELPPQRIYDLNGSKGGSFRRGAFMSLWPGEFAGDRMGLFWAEHNFGTMLQRAMGMSPQKLNVDFLVHGAVGWCGIKAENSYLRLYGAEGTDGPHYEIGFGLGRLMTFMRLDFTWRLTHKRRRNLVISVGSAF